jgi:plasmid stabilization system protein ParE
MTVVWKATARRDMHTIYAHIARYAGPALGYEALAEIHVRINALADHPGLGRAGPKPGTRYLVVRHHSATYRATYKVRGRLLNILRVRDTANKARDVSSEA